MGSIGFRVWGLGLLRPGRCSIIFGVDPKAGLSTHKGFGPKAFGRAQLTLEMVAQQLAQLEIHSLLNHAFHHSQIVYIVAEQNGVQHSFR